MKQLKTDSPAIHISRRGKTHDESAAAHRPPRRVQEATAEVAADSAAHRQVVRQASFLFSGLPAPCRLYPKRVRRIVDRRCMLMVAHSAPMRRSVSAAAAVSGSGTLNNRGNNGYYWSGTENNGSNAWNANFNSNNANTNNGNNKNNGFPVRLFASEPAGFCLLRAFFNLRPHNKKQDDA